MPPKKEDEVKPKFVRKSLKTDSADLAKEKITKKAEILEVKEAKKENLDYLTQEEKQEMKQDEKKIHKELLEIYENDDGTMPNMKQFQKRKSRGLAGAFIVLLLACVFLGAVAWTGFFVFQPQNGFKEADVNLTVIGENKAMIGQEVQYRIRYRNDQNVPLSKAVLQIRYPAGFVFEKSSQEPTNSAHDEWILGSIDSQSGGYIDVFGRIYGNLNENQSFRIFLDYTPANFSSEFQKVSSFDVVTNDSPWEMAIDQSADVSSGVPVLYTVSLHKKIDQNLKNLYLVLEPDKFFNKTSSTPISDKNNNYRWLLTSDADQIILIKGVFNNPNGPITSTLNFKIKASLDEKKNPEFVLSEQKVGAWLSPAGLSANLTINGATDKLLVQPGDIINTSLNLKNTVSSSLSDLVVTVEVDAPAYNNRSIFDWPKLDDPNNGTVTGNKLSDVVRRGTIVWDAKAVPGLKELKTGEEVNLDWQLPIRKTDFFDFSQLLADKININAQIKYNFAGQNKTASSQIVTLELKKI